MHAVEMVDLGVFHGLLLRLLMVLGAGVVEELADFAFLYHLIITIHLQTEFQEYNERYSFRKKYYYIYKKLFSK